MNTWRLIQGDCIERLRELPEASVQCVVTSPPYWGLRDYGIEGQIGLEVSLDEWTRKMVEVFREVRRVLRADGTLWMNLGDGYAQKGDGGLKQKDLLGIPWRAAFALQADGWWLRSDIIWHKANPMPEAVKDRPTKSHEYLFLLAKSGSYFYDGGATSERLELSSLSRGYAYKNREYVGAKMAAAPLDVRAKGDWHGKRYIPEKRNRRTVWKIATQSYREAHFATFPEALVLPCILAGSRPGDTVLDPFNGAGTTGVVALKRQRNYVGIELNPEYVEMSRKRLAGVSPLFSVGEVAEKPKAAQTALELGEVA